MGRPVGHAGGDALMNDEAAPPKLALRTRLSHVGRKGKRVHGFVNPPLPDGWL